MPHNYTDNAACILHSRAYEKEFKIAMAFVQCDPSQPKGTSSTSATVAWHRAATENSKKALA